MSTIFRYLAKEIFAATALLLLALLALFALFDLIHELGDLGKNGYSLSMALAYVMLSQPSHLVVIFPVAALMGTLLAVSRLSTQSELTVMRASGLSLTRLAAFAAAIGLVFSLLAFLFGEFIAPAADEAAKRVRMSANTAVVAQQFRSGFWIKDKQSFVSTGVVAADAVARDNQAFVNIESVTADTELINMRIYEFDSRYRMVSISIAQRGAYDKSNRWVLSGVEKTTFEPSRARIEKLPVAYWNSAMTPDLLSVLRVQPAEMSMLNLSAYIDHLRENRQNSTRYELALWSKILQPAAVIIMMLLAIPFAIQSHRAGGVGAKLLLGIMIGLGFHFVNQLASHLTVLNDWPPLVSASTPLLVFLALAAGLLGWKEYATRFPRLLG